MFALAANERVEHHGGKRHRAPDREQRANLVLYQLHAGKLHGPHKIAGQEVDP